MMPAIDYLVMTARIEFKLGKNLKSKSLILNTYASQRIKKLTEVLYMNTSFPFTLLSEVRSPKICLYLADIFWTGCATRSDH